MTIAEERFLTPRHADGPHDSSQRLADRRSVRRPAWQRRLALWVRGLDAIALALSAFVAEQLSPAVSGGTVTSVAVVGLTVVVWLGMLSLKGSYGVHVLAQGPDEYQRLLVASWHFVAILGVTTLLAQSDLHRGYLLVVTAIGVSLLFVGRHLARRALASQRAQGKAMHRMLVVGPPYRAADIIKLVQKPSDGFKVVGVCTNGLVDDALSGDLPNLGFTDFGDITAAVRRTGADTIAVVGESDMPTGFISQLAWELEGTGVDLMVSPAITDIAGPRIHIRPVAQLPMLYVESPQSRGLRQTVKAIIDPVLASLMLLVLSPLLAIIAVLIKIDSPGPVFFRQKRAGHKQSYFRIWKFRTMRADAEKMAESYALAQELADGRGKAVDDPRITRLGKFLRKTSLDELPQLINVVQGTMSLVGPRPVPAALETFEHHELRRLLVRPGMTGLWQVSGRSDIDWDERVRLDLYYVQNWSPLLDLIILLRTVSVVLRGSGAY